MIIGWTHASISPNLSKQKSSEGLLDLGVIKGTLITPTGSAHAVLTWYCTCLQAAVNAASAEPGVGSGSGSSSIRSNSGSGSALTALVTAINMIFGSAAALSAAFGHQVCSEISLLSQKS